MTRSLRRCLLMWLLPRRIRSDIRYAIEMESAAHAPHTTFAIDVLRRILRELE